MTSNEQPRPVDPQVRMGHVHLKVADLERVLRFYCGVLGFEWTHCMARSRRSSRRAATITTSA
jgi:catechol 2,3-dioxygenase